MTRMSLARLAAMSLALPALAATQAQEVGDSQWGVGLGLGYERRPYRNFDDKVRALPLLLYENRWVSVFGPGIDLKLGASGPLSLRLRARYAGDGYDDNDSPYLEGMDDRKSSVWVGGATSWRAGWGTLSAELLGDASGKSKGSRARLGVERSFGAGDFRLVPRLGVQWFDEKYVNYYYGVRSQEVRSGRSFHDGKSTTNVELGIRVDYALAPRQSVSLDLSAISLGSGIKDSPLVDRSSQTGLRLAYLYRF